MRFTLIVWMLLLSSQVFAQVVVSDAVVREMLPGSTSTAGYFTLTNHTDKPVTLTAVVSNLSERVEVHEHLMQGGMMKMQQVKGGLVIKPHESVVFQPGGYHLMLFDTGTKIKRDIGFELTLKFAKHPPLKASGKVISLLDMENRKQKDDGGHHHHH